MPKPKSGATASGASATRLTAQFQECLRSSQSRTRGQARAQRPAFVPGSVSELIGSAPSMSSAALQIDTADAAISHYLEKKTGSRSPPLSAIT